MFVRDYRQLRDLVAAGTDGADEHEKEQTMASVRYVVVGRLVLESEPTDALVQCGAPTHYVSVIVVGAYRIGPGEGARPGVDQVGIRVEQRGEQTETAGSPEDCLGATQPSPPAACLVPLAFVARSFASGQKSNPRAARSARVTLPKATEFGQDPRATARQGLRECDRMFFPTGDPERDVARLGEMCGGSMGMKPQTPVLVGEQDERGIADRFVLHLEAGQCYGVFGVGGTGVIDLDMGWRAPDGHFVAREVSPRSWSVLGARGPVCIDTSGDYELVVAVERGKGRFAARVWRAGL